MLTQHSIKLDQKNRIQYYIYKSPLPGKTVLISGGIHGDEANGMFVCIEFIKYLKANPTKFTGTIIIVPNINPQGFQQRNRRFKDTDLNRTFTKDIQHPVSKLFKKEILDHIDYGVDFHDSGSSYKLVLHARIPKPDPKLQQLLPYLQVPFCLVRKGSKGMLTDYMHSQNKNFITIESGGSYQVSQTQIQAQINLIINLLKHNGNHIGTAHKQKSIVIQQRFRFKSTQSMLFYPQVKLGQAIQKNQLIGVIYDQDFQTPRSIYAPLEGYLISLNEHNLIKPSEYIFGIGADYPCNIQDIDSKLNQGLLEVKHICL